MSWLLIVILVLLIGSTRKIPGWSDFWAGENQRCCPWAGQPHLVMHGSFCFEYHTHTVPKCDLIHAALPVKTCANQQHRPSTTPKGLAAPNTWLMTESNRRGAEAAAPLCPPFYEEEGHGLKNKVNEQRTTCSQPQHCQFWSFLLSGPTPSSWNIRAV